MTNWAIVLAAAAVMLGGTVSASLAAPPPSRVVIINTGTRTVPGYQVTVEPNGKISGTMTPSRGQTIIRRTDRLIPALRQRFFADLANAEPLNALPVGQNTQAAGAARGGRRRQNTVSGARNATGAQILVRSQGRQSPNLRAVNSTAGQVLFQDVQQVIHLLRFPVPERS